MYMCLKFSHENLNPNSYTIYLTSTYTYKVTIMPNVHYNKVVMTFK